MSRNFSSNKNFDIFKTEKKNKIHHKKRSRKNKSEDLFNEIFNTYETQTRKNRERSYDNRNPLIF